ncbi:hypothetical protein BKA69DRAFT_1057968 [Paraphysoderma sedebokerense]|nr:hypothetical protein BKA69DRAFT_1057968 [Paraphysoderma sedebokerense]
MIEALKTLRSFSIRQIALQILNFLLIVSSALVIWKGLGLLFNTESPIVVVLTGSMEPAFYRGDLLFLQMSSEPIRAGDIVVFKLEGKEIPIVHRVVRVHEDIKSNDTFILTKGDNNPVDDRGLYNPGQKWIKPKDIVGRVKGYVPSVGYVTIVMNDFPQVKYAVLGILGLFVLVNRE